MTATHGRDPGRDQSTRALLAGWIGTTVEYYDFSIYGLASSVVFAKLFFPTSDPVVGTMLSLSTFAIGFLARPVGAVVFGHFGDRLGRKKLADRFGNRRVFLVGAVSLIVLPFVWPALLQTREYWLMLLGFTLLFIGYSANYGVVPAYFSQVFPARLRCTGMSIGFTVGLIAGNAFSPDIATYLLHTTGGWLGIAVYMAAMSVVSVIAGLFLREEGDVPRPPRDPVPHDPAPRVADNGTAQVH
ncbi:hypothetical protein SSPO_020780 [Streptomyces antimycoticus]|uniref:Major facilitator superfamily (MFS) profile domain-containing protein n=1 Tax=Streptomyces antimycoticus TaxID=68175 RepID=A0A499UGV3_9ACTN|nr:MFS transporter [Streptomyces antimycoticus]BBJ39360.1 hypothetical protein SSPO_020780 [Streptomyces antimycoticus]